MGEVSKGEVMEGLVGEEKFELDPLLNREPVELLEDMGVTCSLRVGMSGYAGSRVLGVL